MKMSLKVTMCGIAVVLAGLTMMTMTFEEVTFEDQHQAASLLDKSLEPNGSDEVTRAHVLAKDSYYVNAEWQGADSEGNKTPDESIKWQNALPSQFQGTHVVGSLMVDDAGNLVVNSQARQVLDYFFTAQDDASIEDITAWLEAYFSEQLSSPAKEQASQFLARYIDYKTQLNALSVDQSVWDRLYDPVQLVSQSDLTTLTRVFQEREALQAQVFDQTTQQALFGSENDYDQLMLKRMQVSLSAESEQEMQQQLALLDQQMTPEQKAEREASQLAIHHKSLSQSVEQADTGAQYQTYAQTYGDEAAERLVALAEKRKLFNQKRTQVQTYRDALGEDATPQALEDYMKYELGLSAGEIQRIKMLEKIN